METVVAALLRQMPLLTSGVERTSGEAPIPPLKVPKSHDAEFVDPGVEVATREQVTPQIKAGERAVQNGRFTQSGKAAIEALRPLSPKLAQEVTQALLTRDFFLQQFPGGKKEVAQLRQLAEKNGGEEGIGELQSIAQQMREIDTMYDNADPNFIEKITSDDQGKRNYARLMIPALNKFDQVAPRQMRHYQMGGFMRVMDGGGIPTLFATQAAILNRALQAMASGNQDLAASFLTEIKDNHNGIADFFNKIYTEAQSQRPALDEPKNPQFDQQQQSLDQRAKALQKQEWELNVGNERKRLYGKALGEFTKGRTLTAEQNNEIQGWYNMRMNQLISAWKNNSQRFFQAGDKDGYLRAVRLLPEEHPGRYSVCGQQICSREAWAEGEWWSIKASVNRGTAQPAQGAVRVAKMPPTSQLDPVRTSPDMLSFNKAYTKDGRLVQWA